MSLILEEELLEFCRKLPKAELHAHLSGSISDKTIMKLSGNQKHLFKAEEIFSVLDLHDCFDKFKLLHDLLQTPSAIYSATKDVIKEFFTDGVIYLELRTTPRETEGFMTKMEYIDAVIQAIQKSSGIVVTLLLSIDRKDMLEYSRNTIDLAIDYNRKYPDIVIGIDLSGSPYSKQGIEFKPLLEKAKENGLKLSIHLAEIKNDKDTAQLLECSPDRIGHGTFLHTNSGCDLDSKVSPAVAIELCLTSNIKSKTVPSYEKHHMRHWFNDDHPIVLCTDDKGVFSTSLSHEYAVAATVFSLSKYDLFKLARSSFDHSFASDAIKNTCKAKLECFIKEISLG